MSKVDPYLRFPSGRTIKDVKRDARRFARTADISHTSALNTLARVNGLDMSWSAAMGELSRDQRPERGFDSDLNAPPRIHRIAMDSIPDADLDQSESCDIQDSRSRPHHRNRRQRIRHALQLYREGHLSKAAIAEVCGIPITELQVHICRTNYYERTRPPRRHNGPDPAFRPRRTPYRRELDPE